MKTFGGVALGACVGLLLGIIAGAAVFYLNQDDPSDQGYAVVLTVPLGTLLGAVIGGPWMQLRSRGR